MSKIMIDRAVVEQVMEALLFGLHVGFDESSERQIKKGAKAFKQHSKAITTLRAALAEKPAEPVSEIVARELEQLCQTEANARRLMACWNACEGIETYALELMTGDLSIKNQITATGKAKPPKPTGKAVEYRRQRDELLGALRMLLLTAGAINDAPDGLLEMALESDDQETRNQANAHLCARAAIAKATGEKT